MTRCCKRKATICAVPTAHLCTLTTCATTWQAYRVLKSTQGRPPVYNITSSVTHTHTHTQLYTHTHRALHTHTHARTHTHTQLYTHTHTQSSTHTHAHTALHTHTHVRTHTHTLNQQTVVHMTNSEWGRSLSTIDTSQGLRGVTHSSANKHERRDCNA